MLFSSPLYTTKQYNVLFWTFMFGGFTMDRIPLAKKLLVVYLEFVLLGKQRDASHFPPDNEDEVKDGCRRFISC